MSSVVIRLYRSLFARPSFYRLNRALVRCGLSGMGILNYESSEASGELHFLQHYLPQHNDGVVLDVGAHTGSYSTLAMTINPTLRVYAFEPNVKCFSALSANGAHSNFTPINLALGERTGTLSLYDYAERDGSQHASVYKDVFDSIHKAPATETQIGVTTVDRFVSDSGIDRVALLKIDTEGNELDVLRGARDTLHAGRIEAIQLEFNEMNVVSRTFFRDIWKFLDGYDLYRLLPKALLPLESYTPLLCELFAFQNIVAIRKDRYTPH